MKFYWKGNYYPTYRALRKAVKGPGRALLFKGGKPRRKIHVTENCDLLTRNEPIHD